jgi:hypothetical protein
VFFDALVQVANGTANVALLACRALNLVDDICAMAQLWIRDRACAKRAGHRAVGLAVECLAEVFVLVVYDGGESLLLENSLYSLV